MGYEALFYQGFRLWWISMKTSQNLTFVCVEDLQDRKKQQDHAELLPVDS